MRRARFLAFTGMMWLAMALRAWGLDAQSLWRDEVDTVRFATQPLSDLLHMFVVPGHNGVLYYLLMRPWILFFGHVDYALRYSSLLVGLLAIPLTYQVMRAWLGKGPAWLTALLMAVSPYAIWYSQELRMYMCILCLALLATWCWQQALWKGRRGYWIPYVLLLSAGIYMHFLLALLIPTHILLSLLMPEKVRRQWLWWGMAYSFFILPYIPLAWWQKKLLFSPTFRTGHPFVPWPSMVYRLLTVFAVGLHDLRLPSLPKEARLVPLLFAGLAGLFLYPWEKKGRVGKRWRASLMLVLWFLLPVTGLYLISLELPLFTERYLIWTMPAVYGLAGAGVWALRSRRWVMGAAWGTMVVLMLLGVGYQVKFPMKPDMRGAVAYVESHREPDSVVLLHLGYLIHAYTYYAPESRPVLREAPAPGPQGTLEETGEEILRRIGPARDVWYVESESAMWDPKGLVRQWLETHARKVEERSFVGVYVGHWVIESNK
ncbi:MAG: hypothetical protein GXO55_01915 [Chloroflexi bacterium]|nr:hypothetical protein [Chloroflexota bacterium]